MLRWNRVIGLLLLLAVATPSFSEEELPRLLAVGYLGGEEEVASRDRDSDIPTLYDRNRMELIERRDRWLLRHGQCCPPPGVLVSPEITVPAPRRGVYYRYDPRNPKYRTGR